MLENIKYANAEHTVISATENGSQLSIPVAVGNRHYDNIIEQGMAIADYVPPAPTWAGIRGERDALLKSTDWWGVSDRTCRQKKQLIANLFVTCHKHLQTQKMLFGRQNHRSF